jgi:hypothetical protein
VTGCQYPRSLIALFVASFLLQDAQGVRPRQFVSELSIGQFGWLQMATFFVAGAGFLAFGFLQASGRVRMGPTLLHRHGHLPRRVSVFTTDPSTMFDQSGPPIVIHEPLARLSSRALPP